jgi:hypothetical protein
MRPVNASVLSGADTISVNGSSIVADQLVSASFQATFGDTTAAGAIQIQASNDIPPAGNVPASFTPTNWSNITGATSTVTAGVAPLILITSVCYRWMRVSYTSTTPGTSTMNVIMFAFGV